jgi:hypothetical protein
MIYGETFMKKSRLLGAVCAFVLSAPLQAAIVIDFGTGLLGSGGSINYDGTNATGTDILIGSLDVQGTTSANGTYVVDALLVFDTMADTITIEGTIAALGINVDTVLLSGSFNSFSVTSYPGPTEVFQADGPDTKSIDLLEALGVDTGTAFNFFGFSIESANGVVNSTDFINTAVVPVPAAVWLFGSGLLGMIGIARRKKSA